MKIETIIGAMITASLRVVLNDEPNKKVSIRHRQYHAFRDRILRMDKEKEAELKILREYRDNHIIQELKSLEESWK